jgi:hypothetical protein
MKFRNLIEKCAWKEEVKRIQNVFDWRKIELVLARIVDYRRKHLPRWQNPERQTPRINDAVLTVWCNKQRNTAEETVRQLRPGKVNKRPNSWQLGDDNDDSFSWEMCFNYKLRHTPGPAGVSVFWNEVTQQNCLDLKLSNFTLCVKSNEVWRYHEWWIVKDFEGDDRGPFQDVTIPGFARRDWGRNLVKRLRPS